MKTQSWHSSVQTFSFLLFAVKYHPRYRAGSSKALDSLMPQSASPIITSTPNTSHSRSLGPRLNIPWISFFCVFTKCPLPVESFWSFRTQFKYLAFSESFPIPPCAASDHIRTHCFLFIKVPQHLICTFIRAFFTVILYSISLSPPPSGELLDRVKEHVIIFLCSGSLMSIKHLEGLG